MLSERERTVRMVLLGVLAAAVFVGFVLALAYLSLMVMLEPVA